MKCTQAMKVQDSTKMIHKKIKSHLKVSISVALSPSNQVS